MKRALITGITGQIGSYLAEFLLSKDYQVFGMARRSSNPNTNRIKHLLDKVTLVEGDMTDQSSLARAVEVAAPDECYNLAAQSYVSLSWNQPILTAEVTGLGVVRLLEVLKDYRQYKSVKLYQASSSEMFGLVKESPQDEQTPFHPRSPYGCAKVFAHQTCVNYRESYRMFIACGICFNAESPRRGAEFVTKKIARKVAEIKKGKAHKLLLGNTLAQRDWGFAGDYVEAMWLMLQQEQPKDYVIATGNTHSVQEFVEQAFRHVGLDWREYLVIDRSLFRPADVEYLRGNASGIKIDLKWNPKVGFKELVKLMVDAEMEALK